MYYVLDYTTSLRSLKTFFSFSFFTGFAPYKYLSMLGDLYGLEDKPLDLLILCF